MQTMDLVTLTFNWRHYYYTLNSKGIKYVKDLLGITEAKVQPASRKVKVTETLDKREGQNERGNRRRNEETAN
jgi:hypothetical protein